MLLGICDSVFSGTDFPLSPRGNNLQGRIQRFESQLKAHLIITFSGTAVGNSISSFRFSYSNLPLGNKRPGY